MGVGGGGGGVDVQILYVGGGLTKIFNSLEKRGSLGTFCTLQTPAAEKETVFTMDPKAG